MSVLRYSLYICTLLAVLLPVCHSIAVMSIDLGSEWMKIGIVSPGVPMEIVLNKESKRKTPAVVSFRDNVRTFGEDAQTIAIRFPKNSYSYLLDLLGKDINNPIVKLYQKRFPHYDIVEDKERGTILFKHDGGDTMYSPEELIAQLLHKAKEFAEISSGQPVNECVLTVPGYFNQAERKALLQAASLADLKVLQLINDYTAVALNYGIFRRKDMNDTATYVMFYDMGASSTTATIVSYQTVKTKERGIVETHPQISILGVGYDRTLGGLEVQLRLRDYLATKFNEMKKTKSDVFKNPRSMAKLMKEASRLKNVLSANTEHMAQIEGLIEEIDFKLLVSRDELEALCLDLFERVKYPVEQALKTSHLTMDLISQVVLVGAGTRMPRVQDELQQTVKMVLSKNLNTDESAAMGAVYKAADLSTGFKVKKFITKDAVVFPIQVTFERIDNDNASSSSGKDDLDAGGDGNAASIGKTESSGSSNKSKHVKRTLFGLMNPYPQKKIITFNRHVNNFHFNINYDGLEYLAAGEILAIGNQNLSQVHVDGVSEALAKNQGDNVESKGVKAHFNMDESGILNLINVDFVFEKMLSPEEQKNADGAAADDESPLSKLGNTISKLFTSGSSSSSSSNNDAPTADEDASSKTDSDKDDDDTKQQQQQKQDEQKQDDAGNKDDSKQSSSKVDSKNETVDSAGKTKELKPKLITIKESLTAAETLLGVPQMSTDQMMKSLKILDALNEIDREQMRRDSALNALESFVIDALGKLDTDEYTDASTDKEVNEIRTSCSTVSEWLYEDGSDADAVTYEKKLTELKKLTRDLFARVWEHKERPEALRALDGMITGASGFLNSAKNLTKSTNPEKDVYTDVEIQTLEKVIRETVEWKNQTEADQAKLKKSEPVLLTVKMITEKMQLLDREVKYLVNKLKIWKPKSRDIPVKEDTTGKQQQQQQSSNDNDAKNKTDKKAKKPKQTGTDEKEQDEENVIPSTNDDKNTDDVKVDEEEEAVIETSDAVDDNDAAAADSHKIKLEPTKSGAPRDEDMHTEL